MSGAKQKPIQSPQEVISSSHQAQNIFNSSQSLSQKLQPFNQERTLQRIKSSEELETDFKQNERILSSLNFNIDDLFKKISQLTEQVSLQHQKSQFYTHNQRSQQKSSDKHIQDSPVGVAHHSEKEKQNQADLYKFATVNENFILGLHLNNQQQKLSIKDFQTGKTLGYGKFGQVLQCRHLKTGTLYALKKILKSTVAQYKMQEQLLTQIQAQKRMDHPNIVKIFKSFTDTYHIFILMEFVDGVQLTKKFKSSQKVVSLIIRQILAAIKQMHSKKVVHRDLKPENIIINQKNGLIKIADFGWSSINHENLNIMCGTLDYLSPQMAQNNQYDQKVDLWSVGVLTYELIYGEAPFKQLNKQKTIENIKNIRFEFPDFENENSAIKSSESCKEFVKGFLARNDKRKDIEWGLSHQFITKFQEDTVETGISNDINSLF